jgi:hypothetical protein
MLTDFLNDAITTFKLSRKEMNNMRTMLNAVFKLIMDLDILTFNPLLNVRAEACKNMLHLFTCLVIYGIFKEGVKKYLFSYMESVDNHRKEEIARMILKSLENMNGLKGTKAS